MCVDVASNLPTVCKLSLEPTEKLQMVTGQYTTKIFL